MDSNNTGATRPRAKNCSPAVVNVNRQERLISVVLGTIFFSRGIKKRSLLRTIIGSYLLYRGTSGHCAVYSQLQRSKYTTKAESINIKTSFVVNKPRQEVYDFWLNLENLPLFMTHLKSVTDIDGGRSHWVVSVPGNVTTLSWDAEIVKLEEGRLISWKSLPGATVQNAGKVEFNDALGHQGTKLDVVITYRPPAGRVGGGIAWLLNPVFRKMIEKDIRNFKQYIETGYVPIKVD